MQAKPHHPHDIGYRSLLKLQPVFVDLLRSFVPERWVRELDPDSPREISGDFVQSALTRREADIIYEARLRDKPVIFHVLVELQSTVDAAMAYRLFEYQFEIWRTLIANRTATPQTLPPIVPIVLYNGRQPWTAKTRLRDVCVGAEAFSAGLLDFEYTVLDVERYTDDLLVAQQNTISAAFLANKTGAPEERLGRLRRISNVVKAMPRTQLERFTTLIRRVYGGDKPEFDSFWQETMEKGDIVMAVNDFTEYFEQKGLEKGRQEGLEQGMEQGMVKGRAESLTQVALRLIARGADNDTIAAVTEFTEAKIEELRRQAKQ